MDDEDKKAKDTTAELTEDDMLAQILEASAIAKHNPNLGLFAITWDRRQTSTHLTVNGELDEVANAIGAAIYRIAERTADGDLDAAEKLAAHAMRAAGSAMIQQLRDRASRTLADEAGKVIGGVRPFSIKGVSGNS